MSTVLVVEDSSRVRPLIVRILEDAGFVVLEAGNAEEAMNAAPQADVVLSDITLPDGSGLDLAQQLRLERPDLKFLFMSGFDVRLPEGYPFIEKPFRAEELVDRVRGLLQEPE